MNVRFCSSNQWWVYRCAFPCVWVFERHKPAAGLQGILLPTPPSTQNSNTDRRPVAHTMARVLPIARRPYHEPAQKHDLDGWIGPVPTARPYTGSQKGQRVVGAVMLTRYLRCAVTAGISNYHLPPMAPPPEQLIYFFTAATPQADKFRQNIRQYNAALAFTSLGVKVDNSVNEGGGGPVYAQSYIYDPREALEHRMQRNATPDHHGMFARPHPHAPPLGSYFQVCSGGIRGTGMRRRVDSAHGKPESQSTPLEPSNNRRNCGCDPWRWDPIIRSLGHCCSPSGWPSSQDQRWISNVRMPPVSLPLYTWGRRVPLQPPDDPFKGEPTFVNRLRRLLHSAPAGRVLPAPPKWSSLPTVLGRHVGSRRSEPS